MSFSFPTPQEIARLSARALLEIKAVDFNAAKASSRSRAPSSSNT